MKILYFDCYSGISGDMTLGAFLDLGVSKDILLDSLKKIDISGYEVKINKKSKNGIMGTDIDVTVNNYSENEENKHNHMHKSFKDIKELIEKAELDRNVKELSIKIFSKIAQAEGKIHGKNPEDVHFHEVGAIDSIIDIVGTAICINELKIDKIISSPIHLGMGTVECQHGIIPVPAPATLEILRNGNVPIYTTDINKEIVTPTGASIISTLSQEFGQLPDGVIKSIGYGVGKRKLDIANMLRIVIVEHKKKH